MALRGMARWRAAGPLLCALALGLVGIRCTSGSGPGTPTASSTSGSSGSSGSSGGGGSSAGDPFGVTARIATSSSPSNAACAQAEALLPSLAAWVSTIGMASPGFAADVTSAMQAWSTQFGPYDPLVFGELARLQEAFANEAEVADGDVGLIVRALGMHGRFAGVSAGARAQLIGALTTAEANIGPGPSGIVMRQNVANFAWSIAEVMACLQACAPKGHP